MSKDITTNSENTFSELDWIRVRDELHKDIKIETLGEKLVRKTKENPLVPIGTTATVAALSYGLWSFYQGNSQMSQYMMRARVGAQAFTIFSMVAGFVILSQKDASD
ncbi:HIG1 domain family member 2A, mitochondrial [Anthophora plagiata]